MPKCACRWCLKIIKMPPDFDPKGKKDSVCSDACMANERAFSVWQSDEAIGLRNQEQFGINPNHRGRKK